MEHQYALVSPPPPNRPIVLDFGSGNIFDAFDETPADAEANPFDAFDEPPAQPKLPVLSQERPRVKLINKEKPKFPTGKSAPVEAKSAEPVSPDVLGAILGAAAEPITALGKAVQEAFKRNVYDPLQSVPVVGKAAEMVGQGIGTAGKAAQEVFKDPGQAATAFGAGGAAGLAGVADDLINVGAAANQQLPPVARALFGLGAPLAASFTQGAAALQNAVGGPLQVREKILSAPAVEAVTKQAPGSTAAGEFLLPGAAIGGPGIAAGLGEAGLARALLGGALEGGLAGEAFGTLSGLGQQVKAGQQLDPGKAAGEALPAALVGAGLGTAGVGAGKAFKSVFLKKGEPLQGSVEENVQSEAPADTQAKSIDQQIEEINKLDDEGARAEAFKKLAGEIETQYGAAPEPKKSFAAALDEVRNATPENIDAALAEAAKLQAKTGPVQYRKEQRTALDNAYTYFKGKQISPKLEPSKGEVSGGNRFPAANLNRPEVEPYKAPERVEPEYKPTEAEALKEQERKQFPLHEERLGGVNDIAPRASELSDARLAYEKEFYGRKLEQGSRSSIDKKINDALTQEQTRREVRRVKGLEQDWPENTVEDIAYISDPEVLKQIVFDEKTPPEVATAADARWEELTAPQNIPGSQPAGSELPPAPGAPPADTPTPAETPIQAPLVEGTTGGASQVLPIEGTPKLSEPVTEPAAQPETKPEYAYRKVAGGYEIYDKVSGTVRGTRKESEANVSAFVERLNKGEVSTTQGARSDLKSKNKPQAPARELRQEAPDQPKILVGDSKALTERLNDPAAIEAGQKLTPQLRDEITVAVERNRAYLDATARLEAAVKQLFGDFEIESTEIKPTLDQNIELSNYWDELYGTRIPRQVVKEYVDGVALNKPRLASFDFEGANVAERFKKVRELFDEQKTAEEEYKLSRNELLKLMNEGKIADHVIFDDGTNRVSFQKQRNYALVSEKLSPEAQKLYDAKREQMLAGNKPRLSFNKTMLGRLEKALPPEALNKMADELAGTATLEQAFNRMKEADRGGRLLSFMKELGGPNTYAVADPLTALVVGLSRIGKKAAGPAAKYWSKFSEDLTGDPDRLNPFLLLRRSLDIVEEGNKDLHVKITRNIARETIEGRGLGFENADEALVNKALRMQPAEILAGADGLAQKFNSKQLSYLAKRRAMRQDTAKELTGEIERLETLYPDAAKDSRAFKQLPDRLRTYWEVVRMMEKEMTGRQPEAKTSELDTGWLTAAMYDYIFRLNPSFHALNRLDPLIVGSSRAGLGRILKAQHLLSTDKAVRSYVEGISGRGVVEQLRAEVRREAAELPAPKTIPGKLIRKVSGINEAIASKVPDLPSERWNINDSLAAGFISHGDKIGHKGGGVQFLKDLVANKIKDEPLVDAYVDALTMSNDITGSGFAGIDKDITGRLGASGRIFQFISQPLRQTRLLSRYVQANDWGKVGTLLGLTVLAGGNAGLPKEAEAFLRKTDQLETLYSIQNFMDDWNFLAKVPIVGRDLSDKLRWSLFPILGAETNVAIETIQKGLEGFETDKPRAVAAAVLMLAMPIIAGVGGGTVMKLLKAKDDVEKGERKLIIKPRSYVPSSAIVAKGSRPYNTGNALLDIFLPGNDSQVGRAITTTQQAKEFEKRRGHALPNTKPAYRGLVTRTAAGKTQGLTRPRGSSELLTRT